MVGSVLLLSFEIIFNSLYHHILITIFVTNSVDLEIREARDLQSLARSGYFLMALGDYIGGVGPGWCATLWKSCP